MSSEKKDVSGELDAKVKVEDFELDKSLRPKQISEFIGQEKIIENLRIFIDSARKRSEPLDPVSYTHLDVYKRQGSKRMVISIR